MNVESFLKEKNISFDETDNIHVLVGFDDQKTYSQGGGGGIVSGSHRIYDIGVFIHEFGHNLGLGDTYPSTYGNL